MNDANEQDKLEFERTKEILARILPPAPARVVDVGGAAGAYSFWLAARGYAVDLIDASPRLVEEARRRNAAAAAGIGSAKVGDARALPHASGTAAAVIVMGPLYHLVDADDRALALREAHRVLAPGGIVAAAAMRDPRFVAIRDRDLLDGQHRNTTERADYFTTAYFHRPEELRSELEAAGFGGVAVLGVEGPCWLLADFDGRWADPESRADLLDVARRLEAEPAVVGVSAHLLGIGRKA